MSAIIAGESCVVCKKGYWHSFGHPEWSKDGDSPILKGFLEVAELKKCLRCYVEGSTEEELGENAFIVLLSRLSVKEGKV